MPFFPLNNGNSNNNTDILNDIKNDESLKIIDLSNDYDEIKNQKINLNKKIYNKIEVFENNNSTSKLYTVQEKLNDKQHEKSFLTKDDSIINLEKEHQTKRENEILNCKITKVAKKNTKNKSLKIDFQSINLEVNIN